MQVDRWFLLFSSLNELLTVIVILVNLLLSAIRKARQKLRSVLCISNMRLVQAMTLMYMVDRGRIYAEGQFGVRRWLTPGCYGLLWGLLMSFACPDYRYSSIYVSVTGTYGMRRCKNNLHISEQTRQPSTYVMLADSNKISDDKPYTQRCSFQGYANFSYTRYGGNALKKSLPA